MAVSVARLSVLLCLMLALIYTDVDKFSLTSFKTTFKHGCLCCYIVGFVFFFLIIMVTCFNSLFFLKPVRISEINEMNFFFLSLKYPH